MLWIALQPGQVAAQSCATPGKDGAGGTLTGVVNTYYPGTASAAVGATTMTLGAATGKTTAIASGDLLLVIQMQDATINTNNSSSYGDGVSGGVASGYTAANNAGRYEFIKATSAVALTGGVLTFQGTRSGGGLNFAYTNASFSATTIGGQRRFQVVRVPQYTTATLSSTLTAAAWNGTTGGILALDVSGILTLGGATVSVSGLGFRPGAGRQLAGGNNGASTDFRNLASRDFHGSKGEGISGTPRYMYITSTNTILDNTDEGYTNGSTASGAPGNAGGGGTDGNPSANDENSGGGGGGNGGAGGRGGNSWNSNLVVGGYGGGKFNEIAVDHIVLGGGGGGGTRNNTDGVNAASTGAAGGGIVFMRANYISGTGTINANGADAYNNTLNDGGGGGGAGGTIVFWVKNFTLNGLTLNARGGRGGDAWHSQAAGGTPGERHGPGGGGGGGGIFLSANATSLSVLAGSNGITTTSNDSYGAGAGANGVTATNITAAQIPGFSSGATCTLTSSAVELESFEAARRDGYVVLQWRTGFEADNLGFNLYKEENGQRQLITRSLIAGSALMTGPGANLTSGNSYLWWDASSDPAAQYWLEDLDIDGTSTWHGPIIAAGDISDSQWQPLIQMREALPIEAIGRTDADMTVPVERKAKRPRISTELLYAQGVVAAQAAAKMTVKQEGWHRVTQQELATAGFNVASVQYLRLFADGVEQPFILTQPKGGSFTIDFYGIGADTTWSDSRIYWLTVGNQPGVRIKPTQETGATVASGSFQYTVERSDRNVYYSGLKNGDEDNFFGPVVSPAGADQLLTLRSVDTATSKDAVIEVRLQGVSQVAHQVRVAFNGVELGMVSFTGQEQGLGSFNVSQALLKEGENHLTLAAVNGNTDVSLGVSSRVTYWHNYKADDGKLRLTANAKEQVTIEGFKSADIRVLDVTNANAPVEVLGTVRPQGTGYAITAVAPGVGKRTLLAFGGEAIKSVPGVVTDQPSSLRQKGNGADLIIITTRGLMNSIEPLKALRQSQGLKVEVVDIEDIYDEFSFGQKTPQAVKDFLSYAKSNWAPAPRFALLAGDATFDPRNYLGRGNNDLVPTKLLGTFQMEAASDDWFADFNDDGVAELAIGRLPVRTTQEADAVIAKIVSYDSSPSGNSMLLVNDRNDGYDFQLASRTARNLIPPGNPVVQVDRVVSTDTDVKTAVMDNLNRGPKLVNYLGHGSLGIWNGSILTAADAKSLRNRDQLSVYLIMTCLNGLFQDVSSESLAEILLKSPDGGAVAVWASSGMTEAGGQAPIDQELLKRLFSGKATTVGEAVMNAKAGTSDIDVRRTWIFFGDPSMKLH